MNTRSSIKFINICTLLTVFSIFLITPAAIAATEEEIAASIQNGINYLLPLQNPDGSWFDYLYGECQAVAFTGMIVLKLETHAIEQGMDPLDSAYPYATHVQSGLNYIMQNRREVAIGPQPAGNPDSNGNGIGVYFNACPPGSDIYNTGIAMMALAASTHPEIYGNDLRDATDFMAWAQVDVVAPPDPDCDLHRGGWKYTDAQAYCYSDNSNSGYATLGLGFAAAEPPYGFQIPIPPFVLVELNTWLANMQDPSGGSKYTPYDPSPGYPNILRTGNLLYEFALVGDPDDSARVQNAINYIISEWGNDYDPYTGWKNHRQAMFTMMKGFEAFDIQLIDLDGDGVPEHDWFDEVSTHLVQTQNADGSWPDDIWAGSLMSTAWALLTLERVVPRIEFGIPGQCVAYGQDFEDFDADDYVVYGQPPFDWTWTGNVELTVDKDPENVFSIGYPSGFAGSETITFTATDNFGTTSDDDATFTVDPVPIVGDIPDQSSPFTPFDLDDYLTEPVPANVTWSYSGNSCMQVSIDPNNIVTVTNSDDACPDAETISFTAIATACDEEVSASDDTTFTPCISGAKICELDDDEIEVAPPPGYAPWDIIGGRITKIGGMMVNIPATEVDADDDDCVELEFEDMDYDIEEGVEVCVELDLRDDTFTCEVCAMEADDDDDD